MDAPLIEMLKYLYNQNNAMKLELETLTTKMKKYEQVIQLHELFIEKIAQDDEVILLKQGVFDEVILLNA